MASVAPAGASGSTRLSPDSDKARQQPQQERSGEGFAPLLSTLPSASNSTTAPESASAEAVTAEAMAAPAQDLGFPEVLRGKRVLLATESLGPVNGVSRTTSSLIAYLRANGVVVAVVAPVAPGKTSRLDDPNDIEIRLTGYPLPYNPELSIVYPFRMDRLCQRTFHPDLIYLASPASLGFQVLLQLRQLEYQPTVLCNFQTDLSAYCEILFPKPLDAWAVWVLRSTQGYLFSHPCVKTVFYPSYGVRKYLEKAGVQSDKLVNLRRGVDTNLFSPLRRDLDYRAPLQPKGNELVLVSVSRLAAEKGFDFLSEVAHILAKKKFNFHLLIVGGNRNPAVVEDVKKMFDDIKEHVTFSGFLQGEALARAYASADVFVHSSITETFGLVVLEAMASGIPVIARDEGGPSEIVLHDQTGYLVPPGDVDGFVARVEELGNDVELRTKMGNEARNVSLQATWEKINNRVAWKLAEALNHSSHPSSHPPRPKSSLLLRRPLLSSGVIGAVTSLAIDAQISAGVSIIFGVWLGLIITWLLVQLRLVLRAQTPWFMSEMRKWRNGRLRERDERVATTGSGHGSRRV